MKRTFTILACACTLLVAACTGDSQLPTPTGKGAVRAINAIPGSPSMTFRIEERSLGDLAYKRSSPPARYDDFEYAFNFDIIVPGETDPLRIASVNAKVEVNREHVFVVTGDVANPTITTWTMDLREWTGTDTVFEARFAHLAESLGPVDVYFYDETGPLPVQGEQVATLSYGDVMDPTDFEAGTYVALVTAAGDIGTVYLQTASVALAAQSSHLLSLFDGNENDTSPYLLASMSTTGQELRLPDPAYPATIRFIHGARTLQAVDVYNDDTLTNLVASNIALGETTPDIAVADEATTWYFTPAGSTATVLFEEAVAAPPASSPTELYLTGDTDAWSGVNLFQDRASVSTQAKVRFFHSAVNTSTVDMYIVDRDATVAEDAIPRSAGIGYGLPSGTAILTAGSYDLYLMESGTKTVVGGPYPLDVVLGDVVALLGIDDVNPGVVQILDVSPP